MTTTTRPRNLMNEAAATAAEAETDADAALAGIPNGTFTMTKNGKSYTYQIKTQAADARFAPGRRVVALLSGPDNTTDYTGFGFVDGRDPKRVHIWRSKQTDAFKLHARRIQALADAALLDRQGIEVRAASTCLRCNRKLTVPGSIDAGYGPICAGKAGL